MSIVAGSLSISGHVDGSFEEARFNNPHGMFYFNDAPERLFVADTGNNAIRMLRLDTEEVFTVAGQSGLPGYVEGIIGTNQFNAPKDITSFPNDTPGSPAQFGTDALLVADTGNNRIRKISTLS